MQRKSKIIITAITALSLIIIIFLILDLTGLWSRDVLDTTYTGEADAHTVVITVDSQPLIYDGTSTFNPMMNVKAVDDAGNDVTNLVSYSITSTPSSIKKVINYSINQKDYSFATAQRNLELENYSAPSISFNCDPRWTIGEEQLNTFIDDLITNDDILADDGYGNDISENIYSENINNITSPGEYNVKFSVVNFLGDKSTVSGTLIIDGKTRTDEVNITLTQSSVIIPLNSPFNPYDYIESATDIDGNDVSHDLSVSCDVDTSQQGQYTVIYYIQGLDQISKKLTVVVS
ncbi:MAG TPA: DUF5011 domain-containing protein [Clostridiales bacterium]|nr:DUF5011 domain-containing protein [Clostridiales bacterium]